MLLWLKDNLAMKKDGLPVLCGTCPCQELIFPSFYEVFPFWAGLGDYSIGWTNAGWDKLTIEEYDPDIDLWIDPPYFECLGENDSRMIYYFGFTPNLWANSTGRDLLSTGAKKTCIPGLSECPPPPYYFNVFERNKINPENNHNIRFDFFDLPENLALTRDWGTSSIQVKPGHVYSFKAYDIDEYPEVLLFEGKIAVYFSAFDIHIHDIENPEIDFYAYAIDYGSYPYEYKNKTVPFSVFDMDDNLVFSSFGWNEIAQVYGIGCLPDIDYSLLGKCSFSGNDCTGCLKDINFKITSDFMAAKLAGDCKNIANLEREGSYSYTLLGSGFDTRSDANNYLDNNYSSLYSQMKTQCSGASWFIVGTCECTDDTCSQCMAVEGSITIKCSDEIEDCFEEGGTYYKHARLADGQGFSNFMEAAEYLNNHSQEILDEHKQACPECEDGKYYGIHIWPESWPSGPSVYSNCNYGFPYTDTWDCWMITYFRDNPEEFEMMYGDGVTWEIAGGPFDTWDDAWGALKLYRINYRGYGYPGCDPEDEEGMDYFCLRFYKSPGYRGEGCIGYRVGCYWGSQRCWIYGSRRFVSITEDQSCSRCQ